MSHQALIIVDVQQGFDDPKWGARNNPGCESNIAKLLDRWELAGQPVVVVRHDSTEPGSPLRPGQPGNGLKDIVRDRGDLLVRKSVHSSFHGDPDLDGWLRSRQVEAVAICGITTNHCCETTARVAADLGYQVSFVVDATATFDRTAPDGRLVSADELADMTCTNLHEEFATISTTVELLERLSTPS